MAKSKQPSTAGNRTARSGGGVTSNKLRQVPVKTGNSKINVGNPSGVQRIGQFIGNHTTDDGDFKAKHEPLYSGQKRDVDLGNYCALRVTGSKAGPGADRTVYRSGAQGQHGAANPGMCVDKTPGGGPGSLGFSGNGKVVR